MPPQSDFLGTGTPKKPRGYIADWILAHFAASNANKLQDGPAATTPQSTACGHSGGASKRRRCRYF
ncbi:hypothetical protein BOSE62_130859 [Bosea sp. 62]|nr:hypothetical protein BOSE7B_120890 [Bosea sp. 7B]CAD5273128.1 hypothetical protein BOSE21B_30022 [Bosea sp. 21B]CAD5284976.1 hypothetical protein BOSE46_50224 [Bosea sp. 46]VVT60240.1 hypothetical protein BOS5A_211031 [Bosea sp. EC-HK365B]VXB60538.1 hypothetical protein BOSE62_130859 [Bosea sp. 62]VXC10118.1 hypothetical protein BOSE29B_30022 [Bosea sp. 29B]VXC63026.1 hypothetical protein BOSE125_30403 [Bosea sp. 125]